MTVTIDHLASVQNMEGETIFDARADDMVIPRLVFDDGEAVPLNQLDAWWAAQEPAVRDALAAFFAAPPPATARMTDGPPEAFTVAVPIARSVAADPDYDTVPEIFEAVKEAVLVQIGHDRGDHHRCRGVFEDCSYR